MKAIIGVTVIFVTLLTISNVHTCKAEDNIRARMEHGDLGLGVAYALLEEGEFKKVEELASERVAEDLYILGSAQELQFKCKEAKESYKKVLQFNPNHEEAKKHLQGDGICGHQQKPL